MGSTTKNGLADGHRKGGRRALALLAAIASSLVVVGTATSAVYCSQQNSYYCHGTSASETIYGTSQGEKIYGWEGNDLIHGQGGNDWIYGDSGADSVHAGNGSDVIFGGIGNDILRGDQGGDSLYGDEGNDWIFATSDNPCWNDAAVDYGRGDSGTADRGWATIPQDSFTGVEYLTACN